MKSIKVATFAWPFFPNEQLISTSFSLCLLQMSSNDEFPTLSTFHQNICQELVGEFTARTAFYLIRCHCTACDLVSLRDCDIDFGIYFSFFSFTLPNYLITQPQQKVLKSFPYSFQRTLAGYLMTLAMEAAK